MIVVIRKDLKNTKGEKPRSGKIISQACHSVLGFVWSNLEGRKISFKLSDVQYNWYRTGQTKIALASKSEEEFLNIVKESKKKGLETHMITDAGRTEFDGPTVTAVSIGPDYSDKIDEVTGRDGSYPCDLY